MDKASLIGVVVSSALILGIALWGTLFGLRQYRKNLLVTDDIPRVGLSAGVRLEVVTRFFDQPLPRSSEQLLGFLWNGLLPPVWRILMVVMTGLCLLLLILLWLLVFRFQGDERRFIREPVLTSTAVVTNRDKIVKLQQWQYAYRYQLQGVTYTGASFSESDQWRPGDTVPIEYLAGAPSKSRIQRALLTSVASTRPVLIATGLTFLLLPCGFFYYFWRRRGLAKMLEEGSLAWGRIVTLRQGGRGAVYAKVEIAGGTGRQQKRLVHPLLSGLFPALRGQQVKDQPLLLLTHPDIRWAYLFEPHIHDSRNIAGALSKQVKAL